MMVGNPTCSTNSLSSCLKIPNRPPDKPHNQLLLNPFHFKPNSFSHTHFSFHPVFHKKASFCLHGVKKRGKDNNAIMEMSDFDDDFDDFEEDEEEEEEEEEMGMVLPFGKMKKWLENKPKGFGEGKVYDTRIEDKLLEEIEQSLQAQAANINNLKNLNPVSKNEQQTKTVPDVGPTGVRVRVVNLPKKKNIHRDLKSAFKDVCGILNIIPAVTGNKKTRDPICKGFAFFDFKAEEDAARFVKQFSQKRVAFGKIQKQIKCEMTNLSSLTSPNDESAVMEGELHADSEMDNSFFEETSSGTSESDDPDNELMMAKLEDVTENVESLNASQLKSCDSSEPRMEPATVSFSSKKQDKNRGSKKKTIAKGAAQKVPKLIMAKLEDVTKNVESFNASQLKSCDSSEPRIEPATVSFSSKKQDKNRGSKKKTIAKGAAQKVPKLEITGSAKRLKIKEKAVLTDVFTKYGSKAALASGKER